MDNKPNTISLVEAREIAQIEDIRDMWGAETEAEMVNVLVNDTYAVKFNFVSGSPGYVGDYYIVQGDAIGENPVQLIRENGVLKLIEYETPTIQLS